MEDFAPPSSTPSARFNDYTEHTMAKTLCNNVAKTIDFPALIMASALPFCFRVMQKHLTIERTRHSRL